MSYHPFKVHADASALRYLTTMKNQSGLFTRWYQELADFNFTVVQMHSVGQHTWQKIPFLKKMSMLSTFYEIDEPVIKF